MANKQKNKYCSLAVLKNESDVEQFFALPLLADLGYGPDYLETKATIPAHVIGKGKNKRSYLPDYVGYPTKGKRKPVLIVDAKHPDQSAEQGVEDAQLYASVIRRRMRGNKLDQMCIGINGHRVIVKHFESDLPLFDLEFSDFTDGSAKFDKLRKFISRETLSQALLKSEETESFEFRTVAAVELPAISRLAIVRSGRQRSGVRRRRSTSSQKSCT